MTVFGTRPEAIKMAPLVLALKQRSDEFEAVTVVSAQHRQMLDQVLEIFKITPDYDLDIMKARQTLDEITSNVLLHLGDVIEKKSPILYWFTVIPQPLLQLVSLPFITRLQLVTSKRDYGLGTSTVHSQKR